MVKICRFVVLIFVISACSGSSPSRIVIPSSQAILTTMNPSTGTLVPSFNSGITNYTLDLKNRSRELTWTLSSSNNSTFKINSTDVLNPYSLSVGTQVFTISVTSPSEKNTKQYTVTVNRARQFVYVSNVDTGSVNDTISLFSINPATGQLESLTPSSLAVGDDPYDLLVSPNGENLYVANAVSETISQFSINTMTGALTALFPATVAQSPTPYAMAMTANSQYMYCPNGDSTGPGLINQYFANSFGAISSLTPATVDSEDNPWFLAVTPNSQFLYATIFGASGNPANDVVQQFSINSLTGALTELTPGTVATEDKPWHINIDPTGSHAYLTNFGSGSVSGYQINSVTGQLTELAGSPYAVGTSPVGLTIDPFGRFVYVANSGSNTVSMFSRNATTGELTVVGGGTVAVTNGPYGLEVDNDGGYLYVAQSATNSVSQFSIDQTTGDLTALVPATVTVGTNPRFIRISK
jgi:6-phosphogluconolactonase